LISHWMSSYKISVSKFRKAIQDEYGLVTAENIDRVQSKLTDHYKQLLNTMLTESFRLLSHPPCPYALIGSGSFSRSEVLPYSDVEYLWLFEDETLATSWYFWALNILMMEQIRSLNELKGLHADQYFEVDRIEGSVESAPCNLNRLWHSMQTKFKSP